MKESRHVKLKIFAGYAVLLAICLAAVGYVYREAVRPRGNGGAYALLHSKRNVAAQTLYHLYQAEGYGQLLIAGYESYEAAYRRELRTVRGLLDSLRELERDTMQMVRLDSIVRLVNDKERRTMNLRRSLRSSGTATVLNRNIEQLIEPRDTAAADSLRAASSQTDIVQQDTLRVQRRKRRFFRRLADLFSPPREDSSIVISTTRVIADSVPPTVVSDTIASVLRTLQDRVTGDRQALYDRAWAEGRRLQYSNMEVNRKIYRLLTDFETEDESFLMRRIAEAEGMRRHSSGVLGLIAGSAVVLMLLFVAVLWRDINRSNRYKRALEQANREKEALLEAREQLMLAITHDIKAPLGSIMGYLDLLGRLTQDKRQTLYLSNMQHAAEHLLALVNSLLDFHRLDRRKVDIACVAFSPAQLLENVQASFAPAARAKGIALTTDIDPSAATEVLGDPFRIRQIADNLVSNALKFTDRGSVRIAAHRSDDGWLVFSVRDTGRGIGREEKERIFREFVRLDSAQGVDGFGLGLSIVDRLVKLLGGRISLESVAGQGSKFIVCLPLEKADGKVAPPLPTQAASGIRVLLVDDDPLQLEMTAALCRSVGIEASCCPHPANAARLAAEHRVDAVLTDIQMPGMDGFGVLETIRQTCPGVPVVAVSARAEEPAGFDSVLHKPFTGAELTAAIRTICGKEPDKPRALPETPATGFDALTAFAGDDRTAAREILETFAAQQAQACDQLREALAASNGAAIRALAHRMAPIFTLLGDTQTVQTLRTLERLESAVDEGTRTQVVQIVENVHRWVEEARKTVSLLSE